MDGRAAPALLRMGVDATSAHLLGLTAEPDASQLRFAAAAGRTLVTHDTDFIAESAAWLQGGSHHAGVLLAPDHQDLRWLLRVVRAALVAWSPGELADQVRWVPSPPPDPDPGT